MQPHALHRLSQRSVSRPRIPWFMTFCTDTNHQSQEGKVSPGLSGRCVWSQQRASLRVPEVPHPLPNRRRERNQVQEVWHRQVGRLASRPATQSRTRTQPGGNEEFARKIGGVERGKVSQEEGKTVDGRTRSPFGAESVRRFCSWAHLRSASHHGAHVLT